MLGKRLNYELITKKEPLSDHLLVSSQGSIVIGEKQQKREKMRKMLLKSQK